jgi:hypothetical protein
VGQTQAEIPKFVGSRWCLLCGRRRCDVHHDEGATAFPAGCPRGTGQYRLLRFPASVEQSLFKMLFRHPAMRATGFYR